MRTIAVLTLLALGAVGCSGGTSRPATSTSFPSGNTSTTSATTALEGTWTTDLERSAVRAYIRDNGWGRAAEKALLDPEMSGPVQTEFRLDFVGDRFRLAQVATDEQWMSGTFMLEGDTLTLDDEAPVGVTTFRVDLVGDTVAFGEPGPDTPGFEFMPGVPSWAPAATLWCVTTWRREP